MKKKLFSKNLYIEGLKQCAVFGVLFIFACTLITLARYSFSGVPMYGGPMSPTLVYLTDYLFSYIGTIFILTPILVSTLFSWVNKRNTCDFYHSLPHTRGCILISHVASILTWVALVLLISPITILLLYGTSVDYRLTTVGFWSMLISTIISVLFVISVMLLGISLSGTSFSNLAVTAVILFVPLILFNLISSVAYDANPYIQLSELVPDIINPNKNLIFQLFTDSYNYISSFSYNWQCLVGTLLNSILYFSLALFFFTIRKSETAGQPSINKYVQVGMRVSIALVFCSIASYGVIIGEFDYESFITIIWLYILAIISFFMYELMSTKKVSNMIKAIPSLVVLLVANVVIIITFLLSNYYMAHYSFDEDDISYIRFEEGYYYENYSSIIKSAIKIEDDYAKSIIAKNYNEQLEYYKKYDLHYNANTNRKYLTITACINGNEVFLELFLDSYDYDYLYNLINTNEEYLEAISFLPDYNNRHTYVDFYSYYTGPVIVNPHKEEIYNCLREEYKVNNTKINSDDSTNSNTSNFDFGSFKITFLYKNTLCTERVYINLYEYPKTCQLIANLISKDLENTYAMAYSMKEESCKIYVTDSDGTEVFLFSNDLKESLFNDLNTNRSLDLSKNLYRVYIESDANYVEFFLTSDTEYTSKK